MQYLEVINILLLLSIILSVFAVSKLYQEKYSVKKELKNYQSITKISDIISKDLNNEEIDPKDLLAIFKIVTFSEISSKIRMNNADKISFKEIENKLGKVFSKELKLFLIDLENINKITTKDLERLILRYSKLFGDNNE